MPALEVSSRMIKQEFILLYLKNKTCKLKELDCVILDFLALALLS